MSGPEHPESIVPTWPPLLPPRRRSRPNRRPRATERSPKRPSRLAEIVLAVLVLTFAFLAASFVAQRRFLAAPGDRPSAGPWAVRSFLQTDPFAYTTAGVSWVNHAWLLDRIAYLLYRENADAWLVVLKAAMIAALAGFMLLIRRPGKPGWVRRSAPPSPSLS